MSDCKCRKCRPDISESGDHEHYCETTEYTTCKERGYCLCDCGAFSPHGKGGWVLCGVLPTPPSPYGKSSVETILENKERLLGEKPSNPKDIIGASKIPLHLWPETATILGTLACMDGALKYGRSNYRAIGVRSTIYVDAAKRHLNAWLEGEECAPDSGVPHLGHALACIAIIVDAEAAGKLNDDRNVKGGYHEMIEKWTPLVAEIKARHAEKSPKHYTIQDNA